MSDTDWVGMLHSRLDEIDRDMQRDAWETVEAHFQYIKIILENASDPAVYNPYLYMDLLRRGIELGNTQRELQYLYQDKTTDAADDIIIESKGAMSPETAQEMVDAKCEQFYHRLNMSVNEITEIYTHAGDSE